MSDSEIALVSSIRREQYRDFLDLREIVIDDSVEEIGELAFCGCKNLERIVLPPSLKKIGARAFEGCYSLNDVKIPDSVIYIGARSFSWCYSLEALKIPDQVQDIYYDTFFRCIKLENVEVPLSTNIHQCAFAGTNTKINRYISIPKAKDLKCEQILKIIEKSERDNNLKYE